MSKLLASLDMFNSAHQDIQFTYELESSRQLPFLDTLITRKEDGTLYFGVYRKPTHSGRYLNFLSSNPQSHKKSVVSSLFHRALNICSTSTIYKKERSTIIKELRHNSYPLNFILRAEREMLEKSWKGYVGKEI
jgi:hypothetical protein